MMELYVGLIALDTAQSGFLMISLSKLHVSGLSEKVFMTKRYRF
jgi:hypothetical protein